MANMGERASQSARYFILMLAYGILAAFTYALSLVLGCDRFTVESIVRYEHMIHVFKSIYMLFFVGTFWADTEVRTPPDICRLRTKGSSSYPILAAMIGHSGRGGCSGMAVVI